SDDCVGLATKEPVNRQNRPHVAANRITRGIGEDDLVVVVAGSGIGDGYGTVPGNRIAHHETEADEIVPAKLERGCCAKRSRNRAASATEIDALAEAAWKVPVNVDRALIEVADCAQVVADYRQLVRCVEHRPTGAIVSETISTVTDIAAADNRE